MHSDSDPPFPSRSTGRAHVTIEEIEGRAEDRDAPPRGGILPAPPHRIAMLVSLLWVACLLWMLWHATAPLRAAGAAGAPDSILPFNASAPNASML